MAERDYRTVADQTQKRTGETTEPVRAPSRESDVDTPLGQALIVSLLVTALVVLLAWVFELPLSDKAWAGLVGGSLIGSALGTFLWRMGVITDAWYRIETATGQDINHDGRVGAPHYMRTNTLPPRRAAIDHDHAELVRFVEVCYDKGKDGKAAPIRALRDAKFTDTQIHRYGREMVQHGIGQWVGRERKVMRLLLSREEAVKVAQELVPLMGRRK